MNIELSRVRATSYHCKQAILLYTHTENLTNETLAVEHDVVEDQSGIRLGAGRPVTGAFVNALLESMENATLSYVAPNTIAIGRDALAWFEPASLRTMFFQGCRDEAVHAFDGKAVPQPPLVFIARSRRLAVYALNENVRPTLKTALQCAPYFNVFDTGNVCLGTMRIPAKIAPETTEAWTQAFFASNFTHLSGGKTWKPAWTYAELLGEARRARRFRTEWLKPARMTIEEALCSN